MCYRTVTSAPTRGSLKETASSAFHALVEEDHRLHYLCKNHDEAKNLATNAVAVGG